MSITYSECVFAALGIHNAKRMRRIISASVACLSLSYFSTLSHTRQDFRKTKLIEWMCSDFLYNFFLKHFSFQEDVNYTTITNVHTSSCKVPVIIVLF
jgi:hypothetical protein